MGKFRLAVIAILILCGMFAARASILATAAPATIICDAKGLLLIPPPEPAAHRSVPALPLYL